MNEMQVKGISVLNPVDIEGEYLLKTVEYAKQKGYNHLEIVGAIHNFRHGNIDGMTPYKKYSRYNAEKDSEYIDYCIKETNKALQKAEEYGVKTYIWHHELDLPTDFDKDYPEILNENNDIEVSHPLVKDFLENKIQDFFDVYPKMSGIILTLHETKVPLLKLKNQKLDKKERLKYVIGILNDVCIKNGKELIVRSFASVAEDSTMMLNAISEVSKDLIVMDKWTQFDWPSTLPPNDFLKEIHNPLIIETDISGEYWGKNRLPAMMKGHILDRFDFCENIENIGFVHRIDRNGQILFDTVNEVNLEIVDAKMNGKNVNESIDNYFKKEYKKSWQDVKEIVENTQEIVEKLLHNKGYYFMQGSYFPDLNHSKNHFYFEMMRDEYNIVSDEWFVTKNWIRGSKQSLLDEKEEVCVISEKLLNKLLTLQDKIETKKFDDLLLLYKNLYYCARLWKGLVQTFISYVESIDQLSAIKETEFLNSVKFLQELDLKARKDVNSKDYYGNYGHYSTHPCCEIVQEFCQDIVKNYYAEKKKKTQLESENLTDYVICGGGTEGHKLQKEVNFSDTIIVNDELCRIPGNKAGGSWSRINGHGWFSYELNVTPNKVNVIELELGSLGDKIGLKVQVGDEILNVNKDCNGKENVSINYKADDKNCVRIRIDRTNQITPLIFSIKVK